MKLARKTGRFCLCREFFSRLEEVDDVCLEIRSAVQKTRFESARFAVELVARECLNNAVLHGNGGDGAKQVALNLLLSYKRIRLQVADEGPGFDWRKALEQPLADGRANGSRGLAIIRAYADRVQFNRRGNRITLWLCLQRQERMDTP